jgi:proteic killer suppression protein
LIASFGDPATSDLYHGVRSARARRYPASVVAGALWKLDMLNATGNVNDLRSPPGNRLEALRGEWRGFHSIRVNAQWRVVFRWAEGHAHEVRLIDYHRG